MKYLIGVTVIILGITTLWLMSTVPEVPETPKLTKEITMIETIPQDSLFATIRDRIKENKQAHEKRMKTDREKEERTKAEIEGILRTYGISLKFCNGYVYQFETNGLIVTCCDQSNRIVGDYHRIIKDEEQDMFRYGKMRFGYSSYSEDELAQQWTNEFRYRHFCIDGPITTSIHSLLSEVGATYDTKN